MTQCPMCNVLRESITLGNGMRVIGCPCVGNRTWLVPSGRLRQAVNIIDAVYSAHPHHDPGDEDRS